MILSKVKNPISFWRTKILNLSESVDTYEDALVLVIQDIRQTEPNRVFTADEVIRIAELFFNKLEYYPNEDKKISYRVFKQETAKISRLKGILPNIVKKDNLIHQIIRAEIIKQLDKESRQVDMDDLGLSDN